MNQSEMSAAIMKRWDDAWPGASTAVLGSAVTSFKENWVADEPSPTTPYAVIEILDGDTEPYTLGPRAKSERTGTVVVRLVGEVGVGRKQLDLLVRAARAVFERRRLMPASPRAGEDGVIFRGRGAVTPVKQGRDALQQRIINVSFDFDWYETTTAG